MTLQGAPINAAPSALARAHVRLSRRTQRHAQAKLRVILVRHGRPAIAWGDRTSHNGFRDYIDAYEAAGLDPESAPPEESRTSSRNCRRSTPAAGRVRGQRAGARAHAELIADPLFVEAPLASPRIPLLKLRVPAWAVMSRILWHAGYHPEIENYPRAKHRAKEAADILTARAQDEGTTALVAHGYFNAMIGRELARRDDLNPLCHLLLINLYAG